MALRNQRLVARHRQSENASRTPSSSLGDSDDSSVVVESIEDADVIMGSTADILVINVGTDDEAPTTQSSGSGVSRVKEEHDFQPVRLRVKDEVVLRDNDTMIGDSDEQSSELGVRMNETAMSKPEYEDRVIAMSEQIDSSAEPDQGVDEKKKKEEEEVDVEEVPERLLDKHGHDTGEYRAGVFTLNTDRDKRWARISLTTSPSPGLGSSKIQRYSIASRGIGVLLNATW